MRSPSALNKGQSLFILGCSVIIFAANQLAVSAQIRQPTNAELQRLRKELQQLIKSTKNNSVGANYIRDRRTQTEKNTRESFVRAWSKVEPGLAPFMGVWYGYEDIRHIYPSNIKGRVCVVWTGEGYGGIDTGILSNGVLHTSRGEVILKEGNYLGSASLNNGRFVGNNDIPFNSPRPLETLSKLLEYIFEPADKSNVERQFKDAGCTISKPGQKSNLSINSTNSGKEISGTVVFDVYGYGLIFEKTRLGLPEQDELSGSAIMGTKDIEQLSGNKWFSMIILQDGFVRPAILQRGKKVRISYLGKYYRLIKLFKVAEHRYILNSEHDPVEGGDDYYDIDLRNINNPVIKQINLATAQRLGKN